MNAESSATEFVVRNHLRAVLEQEGVDTIVKDYHDAARFRRADLTAGEEAS